MNTWLIDEYEKDFKKRITINIAKNFKGLIPDTEIAKTTGLSLEEVRKL